MPPTHTSIPVATRVSSFSYAIRNIVAEAQRVEASGRQVRYLNVGNPPAFGFGPPPHLIEAVERALRDGHNGYGPSAGVPTAREAVADEYSGRGWKVSADRVFITAGTSEGIELALERPGRIRATKCSSRCRPIRSIRRSWPRSARRPSSIAPTPATRGCRRSSELDALVTPRTRALVVIDPNNPTGATYPVEIRRALLAFAEAHGLPILADEVYGDLGFDGPVAPLGSLNPDAAVISFSSLSKGYLAPGWRTGWLAVGGSPRLDDVVTAIGKLADGRLCSTVPMEYAVEAALRGDRSHQVSFRAALKERADVTTKALNAMPGVSCVAPTAAFYVMPKVSLPPGRTDEDYVVALLRATGVLCVYGSGFGTAPADGFLRIVFLASPAELTEIFGLMKAFTEDYLR